MTSTVAWLDTSADEQRRVRDMIALFAQQESRDELGIGQIRDVLSDRLFPGTSVLQTRARYFLIVPWSYKYAGRSGSARDLTARARRAERQLVDVLIRGDDDGVIGRRAGAAVKNLPSTLFWSGLVRYGILTREASPDQLTGALLGSNADDAAEELVVRRIGEWHPTIPPAPKGFPWTLDGGLAMTCPEAEWLRDRIVESARSTLLEHLVTAQSAPENTGAPWEDRASLAAPEHALQVLRLAQGFSLMMNGASLLYNMLIAEQYAEAGYTRVEDPVGFFNDAYAQWLEKVSSNQRLIGDWDLEEFWRLIEGSSNRVSHRAQDFVSDWTRSVQSGSAHDALHDPARRLRQLVASREMSIKKGHSRLTNTKLLGAWNGGSGTGELVFRWPQVRRIVTDIHDGLNRSLEEGHA